MNKGSLEPGASRLRTAAQLLAFLIGALSVLDSLAATDRRERLNFLIVVSDDQSAEHTGYAGHPHVATPSFDTLARSGTYFSRAHAAAPTCTASRGALLTGRPIWQLGSGAMLWGRWEPELESFQHILARRGYHVGSTAKGWGPGVRERGLVSNPAGKAYNALEYSDRPPELDQADLAANFRAFLRERASSRQPFSFWAGPREPHRPYRKNPAHRFLDPRVDPQLPGTLPDTPKVRADFAAYLAEIEVFDRGLGELLAVLEESGERDSTVVIVTSDNGMPFSRGKPHNYNLGVRVPLVVYLPHTPQQHRVSTPVSLLDIAPTLMELADQDLPPEMVGSSLYPMMLPGARPATDRLVFSAYERHTATAREGGATYSRRASHDIRYLYIRNRFPDRWPGGDPSHYRESYPFLLRDPDGTHYLEPFFSLAAARRPAEELYYLPDDPYQIHNLADRAGYADTLQRYRRALATHLRDTGDPVALTGTDAFGEIARQLDGEKP